MKANGPPNGVAITNYPDGIDERGFFKRILEIRESNSKELDVSVSFNQEQFTLRGLHYDKTLRNEKKHVNVVAGSIFDVLVDMRPNEPTYLNWFSFHLSSAMNKTLHIPAGIAHGFLTLEPNTIICYVMEAKYDEMQYGRVRCNDPVVGIEWPFMPNVISQKDKEAELLIAHI